MDSQDGKENNTSSTCISQKDKNEVENLCTKEANLKPEKNYENCCKNFIPKSHLKKYPENKNDSRNYDFKFFTSFSGNKKSFSYICFYYESTSKYLQNRKDYIDLYNNLDRSKNFVCTNYKSDFINYNSNENKSFASTSTEKSKTDLDENNNNLYIINNININVNNQSTIKNNYDNEYFKQNVNKDNRNNEEYILNYNLLNQTKNNFTPNNNNICNNDYLLKLNSQNWLNFNQTASSNNNKANFVNKFNAYNIYNVLNEPNINNPPFYPSNLTQQTPNSNRNINDNLNNKKISIPDNKNLSLNIKSNNFSSLDEKDDKIKKEQEDYLIRMFGRTGWICTLCNNFNYETRYKCNRCGLQKKPKKLIELGNKKEIFIKCNKNGDWLCNECQNLNYSFRKVCNRCKAPKPNDNKNLIVPFSNNLVNNNSLNVNKNLNLYN